MDIANSGDTVAVHYTGKLEGGAVFDSSAGRDPLQFEIGKGQVVPGFEAAVIGMKKGDKTSTTIPPELAYGKAREELVFKLGRDQVPADAEVEVGQMLALRSPENREFPVAVTEISEEHITLDANHPLSGKTLIFEIEVVSIEKGPAPSIQ